MVAQAVMSLIIICGGADAQYQYFSLIKNVNLKDARIEVIRNGEVKVKITSKDVVLNTHPLEGEAHEVELNFMISPESPPLRLKLASLSGKRERSDVFKFTVLKGWYKDYTLDCEKGSVIKLTSEMHLKSACTLKKNGNMEAKFSDLTYNKTKNEIKITDGILVKYEGR